MTSFVLKIIALVTMFCDHFGDAYIGHLSFFNVIGRIAFPIFAFQISEGFLHTKDLKKYFTRLFIFAIVSQVPFSLFLSMYSSSTNGLNIFFTLLLGLLAICIYDYFVNSESSKPLNKYLTKFMAIIYVIIIAILGELIHVDYGAWGVLVIFIFYLFKNNKLAMILSFILLCVSRYSYLIFTYIFNWYYVFNCIATISPIILISLYNGKQGKKIKYLLYIFYPLHLLLLYFIFG